MAAQTALIRTLMNWNGPGTAVVYPESHSSRIEENWKEKSPVYQKEWYTTRGTVMPRPLLVHLTVQHNRTLLIHCSLKTNIVLYNNKKYRHILQGGSTGGVEQCIKVSARLPPLISFNFPKLPPIWSIGPPLYRHRESLIKKTCFLLKLCRSLFSPFSVDLLIRAITYRDGRFQLADEIVNVNGASLRYQTNFNHPCACDKTHFTQKIHCRGLTMEEARNLLRSCQGEVSWSSLTKKILSLNMSL